MKPEGTASDTEVSTGDVAIIGMAGLFPGARDLCEYWQRIVDKKSSITSPPPDWEAHLYLDQETTANDKVYCAEGGYLGELAEFNPLENGVMPNSVDGTEPDHFLALKTAREALADAGYLENSASRERTEVIIGRGSYVNRGNTTAIQHGIVLDRVISILKQVHPEHSAEELASIRSLLKDSLPPFHAETAPGLVPNIISGRIANRLDLMGANYIVDAACASSLLAVDLGMRDLLSGRCDMAVVGGVHASTPPPIMMIFCQLKAISPKGVIRPFDRRADGTLLGEGVGMVVLKRRRDAERDGDRIYALVKGVGIASDGKAKGLLAPRVDGEVLALQRAYEEAGIAPSTIGLVEAHGTATPVGDVIELEALNEVFGWRGGGLPSCALGSVKSMISHLMPASGIAGLIKAALALHHKVLPPTLNCEEPHPGLNLSKSVFYLNTETRPWIHGAPDSPRRAGINSFGFGGINAHAILEEYPVSKEAETPSFHHRWDSEAVILSAPSKPQLKARIGEVIGFLTDDSEPGLKDIAFTLNVSTLEQHRLAVVAKSPADLKAKLERASEFLENPAKKRIHDRAGIYFFEPSAQGGKVAFVFPGEGAQFPSMLSDLCMCFPSVRDAFDLMDRAFWKHPRGFLPSQVVFPPPALDGEELADKQDRLWDMDSGAESVFVANQALFALLDELSIRPDAMLGHSTGEHSALLASGAVQMDNDEELIKHVLKVNAIYEDLAAKGEVPEGRLIAVGAGDRGIVDKIVARHPGKLFVAMDNCPHQVVLCGSAEIIDGVILELQEKLAICQTLPFQRAYHTPWFEVFSEPLRKYFNEIQVGAPRMDVYSAVTAGRYPTEPDGIRALASVQWAKPVRFRETIEAMHKDGIRIFVEVGPRGHLISFIKDILRGQDCVAIPASVSHRSGIEQLNHLVAQLAALGVSMDLKPLYQRRDPQRVDFSAPKKAAKAGPSMRLAMGLQPLRLPADFRLSRTVETGQPESHRSAAAAIGAPVGVKPSRAAQSAPLTQTRSRQQRLSAPVMQAHLRTMETFLQSQAEVMGEYLAGRTATLAPSSPEPVRYPFLAESTDFVAGERFTCVRRFELDQDLLFLDHTLGRKVSKTDPSLTGLAVVPLTISMEILAEAASMLQPGLVLGGMKNVRAYQWITLEEPAPSIWITAEAVAGHPGMVNAKICQLDAEGRPGPPVVEGTMVFTPSYSALGGASEFSLEGRAPSDWSRQRLYSEGMFHGPSFRAVQSIDFSGSNGNEATLITLPRQGLFRTEENPLFVTDPVVLDAAGQVVAFWTREELEEGFDIFPYRLEELQIAGPPPPAGVELQCRVQARLLGRDRMSSDIEILDPQGSVLYRLKGWDDRRFDLPEKFLRLRISAQDTLLSDPLNVPMPALPGQAGLVCRRIDGFPEDFLEAHGRIWSKVFAHIILDPAERDTWSRLSGSPKRRREWLLGRMAVKESVRVLLQQDTALELCAADIEIVADAHGRPTVEGPWIDELGSTPRVSIAHSGETAVAAATLVPGALIGIDVETVRPRRDFEKLAFGPREMELLADLSDELRAEWLLRFWCAKEALVKALGLGFTKGLRSVSVVQCQRSQGIVELQLESNDLKAVAPRLDGIRIPAYTIRAADLIVGLVYDSQDGLT